MQMRAERNKTWCKKVTLIDMFIFIDMSHEKKVGLMWVFYSLTPRRALCCFTQMFNEGNRPLAVLLF